MQLISILVVGFVCTQLGHALSLEKSYDKIEKHLLKHVETDEVEANMQEAANLLVKLEEKSTKCFTLHRDETCSKIAALGLLLQLKDVLAQGSCNYENLRIVKNNDAAAKMSSRPSLKNPTRRVEKIVHHYAKQYYNSCYPDKISPKFDTLDPENYKYAMNIGEMLLSHSTKFMARDCIRLTRENICLEVNNDTRLSFYEFAKHPVTLSEYNKFLIQPCKEVEQKLGDEFKGDTLRDLEYYDISLDQKMKKKAKFMAVENCHSILQSEDGLFANMMEQMGLEEQEEKEAEERAEALRLKKIAKIEAEKEAEKEAAAYSGINTAAYASIIG